MEFDYESYNKEDCWYREVCNGKMCGGCDVCLRHYKMCFLTNSALMSGKRAQTVKLIPDKVDLEAFKKLKEIKDNIGSFVKDGKNLLIFSQYTGNGKTEFSKKLMLSWLDSVWSSTDFECRGLFISLPRLMQAMKENISKPNEYYAYVNDNVATADLVVWDEINYKEWTAFEQDYMLNIISQRLAVGKSNIYTTNYRLEEIENRLGTRLSSRIIGASELVEFKGTDKRGFNK